mmetsp:Transcript_9081/g.6841  ORF Transcript_9081/g.6841 Transcript_9081/m.6841 type:complete len:227 (-) Transcript_9081:648-1328(-)
MELDQEIMEKLLDYLLKRQTPSNYTQEILKDEKGLYEALDWLKEFLKMFMDDYQTWRLEEDEEAKEQAQMLQKKKSKEEEKEGVVTIAVEELPYRDEETRKFLQDVFQKTFPKIIQAILMYAHLREEYKKMVQKINEELMQIVLIILKSKDDFLFILRKLKKEFKLNTTTTQKKEIIILWFTELFKAFQEELIDDHQDVFEMLIDNIDFNEQNLMKRILELLCMLS